MRFSKIDQDIIRAYVRKLPQIQRKALILRYWKGMPIDEVSRTLKLKISEVEKIIAQSQECLKADCLKNSLFKTVEI